jgi:hypothetical protein
MLRRDAILGKHLLLLDVLLGAILVELKTPLAFRGAILMTGTAYRVSNLWADISASLVVQGGVIVPRESAA